MKGCTCAVLARWDPAMRYVRCVSCGAWFRTVAVRGASKDKPVPWRRNQ